MIDFTTATAATLEPDPQKRVNYVPGLVLGADEFVQEHVYLIGKQRLHNQLLHGYGTITGLAIEPPAIGSADPQILVRPGVAVDQLGREIRVPSAMCVKVNNWLDRHRDYLERSGFVAGSTMRLCLVLCFKECEADTVPVPGEPCRSQNDVMRPSRIQDAFELRLCVDPRYHLASPPGTDDLCCCPMTQPEEDAVRAFGEILARVAITTDAVTYATRDDLLDEVRGLTGAGATSPPGGPLYLLPGTASDLLREMFRVWVTEVRPAILEREQTDPCQRQEPCVLLADLDLPVSPTWLMAGAVTVDESRRPYLLHTRLLQEWLLCGRMAAAGGEMPSYRFASAFVTGPHTVRAWIHHPVLVDIPQAAVTFSVDGSALAPPSAITRVGAGVNVFDIRLPGAPLSGNARVELRFDAAQMTEQGAPAQPFTEVIDDPAFQFIDRFGAELRVYVFVPPPAVAGGPPTGPAGGDLSGNYPKPTVGRLQGRPVGPDTPSNADVLTWNGAAWVPAAPAAPALPAGAGDVLGSTYPNLTVVGLQGQSVAAAVPTNSQVLTWDQAHHAWTPRAVPVPASTPPSGAAGGDLAGTYPHPTVAAIQKHAVANTPPAVGQALAWRGATGPWTPSYVVAAVNEPYTIVAAGIFDDAGRARGPVYNSLTCTMLAGGTDYTLQFPGYSRPDPKHTYIVKGTVWEQRVIEPPPLPPGGQTPQEFQARPTFWVVQFNAANIRVRALGSNNAPLKGSYFMVEISQIG